MFKEENPAPNVVYLINMVRLQYVTTDRGNDTVRMPHQRHEKADAF